MTEGGGYDLERLIFCRKKRTWFCKGENMSQMEDEPFRRPNLSMNERVKLNGPNFPPNGGNGFENP